MSNVYYFFAEGMITEILYPVKRGKEAIVYCCRLWPSKRNSGFRSFMFAYLISLVYREFIHCMHVPTRLHYKK